LEIAKGIQQSFLPDVAPSIEGFDIAAMSLPARMVGGDFYDFIPIDKDKWGLVVADVSGKGVPAALFMALSRTLVRATTKGKSSLEDSIKQANQLIVEDSKTNMFVTLFYAVLDSKKMSLKYVNAGHNPPLLFKGGSSDILLLEAMGIPLGVLADRDISSKEVKMKKGDVAVLYTDGVTEALNDKGEQFEVERLSEIVRQNRNLSAAEIIQSIQQELEGFVGKRPQFDDITLMVVKANEIDISKEK
jgi:sigma-B regulation protein RsbU (phosphoserine phosphatase)